MSARMDIVVVGAGAAGIAAAICAARSGCTTLLMDNRPSIGGTGGHSGLNTLCGLYDEAGNVLNDGFTREFANAIAETAPVKMGRVHVLPYRPAKFREVASTLLSAEPRLQVASGTTLNTVTMAGQRIGQVNEHEASAVIDCTGTAEVARAVDAECLASDENTQAPAVIFTLQKVDRDFSSAAAMAQVLLPLVRAGFPPLNFQPDLELHTVTIKFTGRPDQVPRLIEFLKNNVAGFENCVCTTTKFVATPRAGRMIMGRHLLSGNDVLSARKFPDAVARAAWPIEQWGTDGIARYRYLPEGGHYDIPAGCLRAARVENLFMAGKTISADVDAIASARVMGCCLATGAAAGNLAAKSLHSSQET